MDSRPSSDPAVLCHSNQEPRLGDFDVNLSGQCEQVHPSTRKSKAKRHATLWLKVFAVVALSSFTVFYTHRVLVSERPVPPVFVLSPGKTVSVVNILSHIVAF